MLPQDRIIPFLGGGSLLRSSALEPGTGVVVALGGAPVDLVVARDMSVNFLTVTTEPTFVFRVFEKIVLRIKQPEAHLAGLARRTRWIRTLPRSASERRCRPSHPRAVAAGSQPTIELVARPGHPSNRVDVSYRVDGGPVRVAHAAPVEPGVRPEAQTFLARLPALASGQRLEYRAELRRAGRLIDVAPADGTWMTMTAEARPRGVDPRPPPASDTAGSPRFGYELELLGALTVRLRPEVLGHTPDGYRINFFVVQGEIRGPRLQRHGTARGRRLDGRPSGRRRRGPHPRHVRDARRWRSCSSNPEASSTSDRKDTNA